MFSDTGKQNVLLPDESNRIIFSDTGKQNVLLPDESNKIMFSDIGKQNVLLPENIQANFDFCFYVFILHSECKSCNFGGKTVSKQIDFVDVVMF